MKTLLLGTILGAGLLMPMKAAETEADITTFPVKGITGVDIRTNSALIYVEGSKGADIRVGQLPDNARVCDVTMKVDGNRLLLQALDKAGKFKNVKTGFRVQLPAGIPVNARTNSNDVTLFNIAAHVEARTNSGDVLLREIAGPVEAKTNSGDMQLRDITGPVEVKTTSGNIKMENLSGSLSAITDSGDIHGDIKAPEKAVTLKTTSGDIEVTLPETAQIAVDAGTTSGKAKTDFSGKAGLPVTARTVSGDISITKAGKQP